MWLLPQGQRGFLSCSAEDTTDASSCNPDCSTSGGGGGEKGGGGGKFGGRTVVPRWMIVSDDALGLFH